jgi:hypothetical protein
MKSRRARLILLTLLATLAFDLADADCIEGGSAKGARCASPTADCACCVLSEVAAKDPHLPLPGPEASSFPAPPSQVRAGVRPVLYRPPLALS